MLILWLLCFLWVIKYFVTNCGSCVLSQFNCAWRFVTLWTVARQVLCPWGFSRWEYWNVLSCPHPGIEPVSPAAPELQQILYKPFTSFSVSSVQSLSRVWLFATPWTAARQASLSITNSQSPPKPMLIVSVIPSNHQFLFIPFSSCPQSFPASGSFPRVSSSHQVAKVLEFQLKHQSFQWTPRTDLIFDGLFGTPCSPRDS